MYAQRELTISEVSRLTNTPRHTLRFWEKEFEGILTPMRTKGGQRRYTEETVVVIEQIRRLRKDGASLAKIKHILKECNQESNIHYDEIDNLVQRVSAMVRDEIYHFLRGEHHR